MDDTCLPRLVLAFDLPLTPLTSVVELAKVCWRLWKPAAAEATFGISLTTVNNDPLSETSEKADTVGPGPSVVAWLE